MPLLTRSDLRDAARALYRTPFVSASAVGCLALALAVTADVFSAVSRVLLEPLPFRDPARLVTVYRTTPHFDTGPFSAPNFEDLARDASEVSGLSAIMGGGALVLLGDEVTRLPAQFVSGEFFEMLGARPLRGRLIAAGDASDGAERTVVISEALWTSRLGGDAAVLGKAITVEGEPHTIIGVVPRDFRVPTGARLATGDLWLPLRLTPNQREQRFNSNLQLLGRLVSGATLATAQADLARLFEGLVQRFPQLDGEGVRVVSLPAEGARSVRTPLLLLLGAVTLVLLIAASNVASLLLARSVQRRRESAVRLALGGTRWDVMRPVLMESALLTATGLVMGLALAWVGLRLLGTLAAARIPQLAGVSLNVPVIAFTMLLSLLVAVGCGAAPAWRGARLAPQDALRGGRGGGQDRGQRRLLQTLVVAEVALSLVLLLNAGLVLRGFATLMREDPGFEPQRLLTLQVSVTPGRYEDRRAVQRFLQPAIAAIEAIPGVESAASISMLPYDSWGWNSPVRYEGRPRAEGSALPLVETRYVTPGFFAASGQRLVAGRLLTASDDEASPSARVVVANEALVRRDFPGADPIGKRYHLGDTTFATIVGVVSDIRNFGPYEAPRPEFYVTFAQGTTGWTTFPIVVRTATDDVDALVTPVRAALRSVDPQVAITRERPMAQVIAESVGRPRFFLSLLGVFAAVAVVLALAGVYGVMSYAVAQRTREFGIRAALGSGVTATVALVTREGGRLVAIGLALGLAFSAASTRLMQSLLFGVSPLDPSTWVVATLLLAVAGIGAALIPAARSARIDPIVAMRTD